MEIYLATFTATIEYFIYSENTVTSKYRSHIYELLSIELHKSYIEFRKYINI